jgi:hypothetical protein
MAPSKGRRGKSRRVLRLLHPLWVKAVTFVSPASVVDVRKTAAVALSRHNEFLKLQKVALCSSKSTESICSIPLILTHYVILLCGRRKKTLLTVCG